MFLQEAAILGLLSFVMSLVVLIFFSSVLLNVVDAVFMCYAMDLDTQSVTKADVHEVFSQVGHGCASTLSVSRCSLPDLWIASLCPTQNCFPSSSLPSPHTPC